MKPKHFINQLQHPEIVDAIRAAEKRTSGEIRVFITRQRPEDPIVAAQAAFNRLGMDKTRERNGVLIYVAPHEHKFAVIGDAGVHARCGDRFWEELVVDMTGHFKKADFTTGLVAGIKKAADLLAEHFPRKADDSNELPDDVAGD